ncbi:MAG TPA: hypothetical protein VMH80_03280 [Bryobacteraceae bacterium]|nr:hypothetical protein [Bryobacteraceae bacterium]
MAFASDKGLVITDMRGAPQQDIVIDLRKIEKHAQKGAKINIAGAGFAENSSVLCAGVRLDTQVIVDETFCIDLAAGREVGTRPKGHQGLGYPVDSAEQASRAVWGISRIGVRDVLEWVPVAPLLSSPSYHPAFLVWDYRAAARILKLGAFRSLGSYDRPVAITSKCDEFAMVLGNFVLFWDLP